MTIPAFLDFVEGTTSPSSPTSGRILLYPKSDNLWYGKTSAGVESPIGGAPLIRNLIAGAGLTGGGDLSADRTFDVVANADGTITVNTNDIQVGILVSGNIPNDLITNAKLANVATATIKGRTTASTGDPEDLTPAQARTVIDVPQTTRNVIAGSGLTGGGDLSADRTLNVVANADGTIVVAADDVKIGTLISANVPSGLITLAKMADMATDRLIGRDTAGTGVPEALTVGGGVEFSGSGGIQSSAYTGDVTKTAAGTALTIPNNTVDNARLADMATARFKGRTTASTGDPEDLTGTQATAMLDSATTSLKGLQSAADKSRSDNWFNKAFYNVLDNGLVGDDSTDNQAALNALYAAVPSNSTIFFPPGNYRISAEIAINADKAIRFQGCGKTRSVIKTTSNTANIFNISPANAWYNTFEDLGFTATGTPTAGAAILVASATAAIGTDIRRCRFTNLFKGIHYSGPQSGNLAVIDSVDIASPVTNSVGIKIDGSTINVVITNSTINMNPGAGAPAGTKGIEINQCGAVQIVGCDFIGGVNTLHLNATALVSAVYVTNTYFDQAGGSTIKISGGFCSSRIKIAECGIAAGLNSTHAVEINGTGAGAVGTSTALPAGIDIFDCDIYYAPGSSSADGVSVNGCQEFTVRHSRITGFANGVRVVTGSSGIKFSIVDNTFGANNNLTINNTTDVTLVNASTYGSYRIARNFFGSSAKLSDAAVMVAGAQRVVENNQGLAISGSTVAADQAIAVTTEVILTGLSTNIPAGALRVGTMIRFEVHVISTNANAITPRARCGPTGAITDLLVVNTVPSTQVPVANTTTTFKGWITVKAVGATGNARGQVEGHSGTTVSSTASALSGSTLNTTVSNILVITLQQATAGSMTVIGGTVEVVNQ